MTDLPPRIYLDNAATSWPKPDSVYDAVDRYQREIGAPYGRGHYSSGEEAFRVVSRCRKQLATLLGVSAPERVVFTFNATDSLNLAIHGLVRPGDHVITTQLEHNSVTRPLRHLEHQQDIQLTVVSPDSNGLIVPEQIHDAIRPNTRLIAVLHASNVTGLIQPVEEIGTIARERDIPFLLDAAQTAGTLPIQFDESPFDLLACAGHKGLLGPLGTGVLCLTTDIANRLQPVRQGGTGTRSELERQPESLPDRFESGNHNVPGLFGLDAGIEYLLSTEVKNVHRHEVQLIERLRNGLESVAGIRLIADSQSPRIGVQSVTSEIYDPQTLATLLSQEFGIETRAGLHCAPGVHKWLGTDSTGGTVRLSVGPFTTESQISKTIEAFETLHQA